MGSMFYKSSFLETCVMVTGVGISISFISFFDFKWKYNHFTNYNCHSQNQYYLKD